MKDSATQNEVDELSLAVSTPLTLPCATPFSRTDDVVLLDLGFEYVDSCMMRGTIGPVTWYVDLEAKRAPLWSYMVHGIDRSPRRYGRMDYDDVANGLTALSAKIAYVARHARL